MSTPNASLQPAQLLAVNWDENPILVLAGPGTGKTMVLTSRIARLIDESPDESFRVLALTFTNKAANEMLERAHALCPAVDERAFIGTFHSFCMQILQQHGSHIGVEPGFSVYSQDEDRRELLKDALRRRNISGAEDAERYLRIIDKLKGMLVPPDESAKKFRNQEEGLIAAEIYGAYEEELARVKALDFNSLIMKSFQLISRYDSIAQRYRRTYRYWMLDEFQDTNQAQYKLLQALAGADFKNVFVVADDDQIIYQWNGASFAQLQKFRADFSPQVIQLPTNFRCPAPIVNAANNLVRHNTARTATKLPLTAGKLQGHVPATHSILLGAYPSERDEASAVASMINANGATTWSDTVVLARSRGGLELVKDALHGLGVNAVIAQRRDDFASAQFRWLHATLRQIVRPQDVRNFSNVINAFNRWCDANYSAELICAQAGASGRSFLSEWLVSIAPSQNSGTVTQALSKFVTNPLEYKAFIAACIATFDPKSANTDVAVDLDEDSRAWQSLDRAISQQYGKSLNLEEFLQHISLQSKEPPVRSRTVTLMTIHAAKGAQFSYVYLVNACEGMLPSFQSVKAGDASNEMEEERRNCFVAITRTKEQLVITWPQSYRGYRKYPSRFLTEMGFDPLKV